MSENLPNGPARAPGITDPPRRNFAPGARMRGASVTLRDGASADGESVGSLMDPATQSLADALRITYKIVIGAVVLMMAFYVLSGFRSVSEGEQGIRLVFGNIVAEDVRPGFRFSWPEPFGELVKVQTGVQSIAIESDYFPELTDEEKKKISTEGTGFLSGGGRDSLNPDAEGSNLTADGNIAHTRWSISYHRENPTLVEKNITPDQERAIVTGAIRRGIVRALASVSIDELLKNTPDPSRGAGNPFKSPEHIARDIAQETLDRMDSGIRLDAFSLTAKIPPRRVMTDFNSVQSAEAERSKAIDDAESARKTILNGTAGEAAPVLLTLIDRYEKQVELKQEAEAAATLASIDDVLVGEKTRMDGTEINPHIVGTVTTLLSEAARERTSLVSRMESDSIRFAAKRDSFRENPLVLVSTDWADAFQAFVTRKNVQQMLLPPGMPMILMINQDPQIASDIEAEQIRIKAEQARSIRERQAKQAQFESKTEPITPQKE